LDKESHTVAHAFDHSWLCHYPRPLICLHEQHGNQIHQNWVSRTPSILWNKGSDCKYHQPTDQCDPQMHRPSYCKPTLIPSLDVHQTQLIGWHSTWAPCTCTVGNEQYLPHHSSGNIHSTCLSPWHGYAESLTYSVGNLVLIRQDTNGKLAKPTHGPYQLIDVVHQHVNGTVIVELNHSHKMFNIQWLIPFKPCQNHWRHNLLYHVPHHIIFLLVIMIHTSGLSPCSPTLLENPFTFFTNTHHPLQPLQPLQRYHLSFSTKKDCIFPHNTVLNLDVAPCIPVCHIIT
jgi:hypothetical protein